MVKLNHCMSTSGPTQHDCFMQLDKDGDFFEITAKLPLKKSYIKSADDAFIESESVRINNERLKKLKQNCHVECFVENEEKLKGLVDEKKIQLKVSQSSFKLSDVTSFVYGPFTSRFWMLRKHIITMCKDELQKDPSFYAWECITICFKGKWDVYLIIRNEEIMTMFLKLLIMKTRTIDGKRDTALIFNKLVQRSKKHSKCKSNSQSLNRRQSSDKKIDPQIMSHVFTKYKLMRVRQKISYQAFLRNQTILEFWVNAIYKSYNCLKDTKQLNFQGMNSQRNHLVECIKNKTIQLTLKSLFNYQIHIEKTRLSKYEQSNTSK